MTTATATAEWLETTDYAPVPQPTDLKEFFGVPPAPETELDQNIRSKRRHWKKRREKARSVEGLNFAESVLQAIADAEDALKRGAAAAGGGETEFAAGPSRTEPATIDEVWRELERLLFRGRYRDALDRVRRHEDRWGRYPSFVDVRAWVILEAAQNAPELQINPALLASAVEGARSVITQLGPSEARFLTLIDLLELSGRGAEVAAVVSEATSLLGNESPAFLMKQLLIDLRKRPWDVVLRRAVGMVDGWPDDRALRSDLVQMLIRRAVEDLLPLKSREDVATYRVAVDVAAWVAHGVPEAEDFVRWHRMWASNADQPIFGGNWQWRAFFALVTGFIALPLINASMSKSAYQVLLDGPAPVTEGKGKARSKARDRTWFMVTRNAYVAPVHAEARLPWQARPGEWPEVDAERLFQF